MVNLILIGSSHSCFPPNVRASNKYSTVKKQIHVQLADLRLFLTKVNRSVSLVS